VKATFQEKTHSCDESLGEMRIPFRPIIGSQIELGEKGDLRELSPLKTGFGCHLFPHLFCLGV